MNTKVYHGSQIGGLKELVPQKSTHLKEYVYATLNPVIALIFATPNLGDIDFDLRIKDNKVILTERFSNAFDKYNCSGYLYQLDGTNFYKVDNLWEGEVVSTKTEIIEKEEYISNILEKLNEYVKTNDLVIYRYPNKPEFIPKDDSDLVDKYIKFENEGHKGSIDNLLWYHPHLKEKIFSKLENPEKVYFIGKSIENFEIEKNVYDNVFDAVLGSDVFIRDDGWLNYQIVDSKLNFEKGNFNYTETFYLYELTGDLERVSTNQFKLTNSKIISKTQIDLHKYDKKIKKKKNVKIR